eukprot:TRINITY_DN1368_c2_g1_i1.p1 TRINITY_DN1368_c2_g1~~TRINITY_DN1368_c2_g1_i1.p1  ORF type:complete len:1375 (+),score=289.55 TRINITY_DN1368_c2_g1_i1:210-4127(+)
MKQKAPRPMLCLCSLGGTSQEVFTVHLPSTQDKFPSELLSLISDASGMPVGLLACAPEGKLKLWCDLRKSELDLVGIPLDPRNDEKCLFLRRLNDTTYALSTSKGRLLVLSYDVSQASQSVQDVQYRELTSGGGWASGIGRWFGLMSQATFSCSRALVCSEGASLLHMTDSHIQQWALSSGDTMKFHWDAHTAISRHLGIDGALLRLIDLVESDDTIYVLVSALGTTKKITYTLVEVTPTSDQTTPQIHSAQIVYSVVPQRAGDLDGNMNVKILYTTDGHIHLIFNDRVVSVSVANISQKPSEMKLPGGSIIGYGSSDRGTALVMSSQHGAILEVLPLNSVSHPSSSSSSSSPDQEIRESQSQPVSPSSPSVTGVSSVPVASSSSTTLESQKRILAKAFGSFFANRGLNEDIRESLLPLQGLDLHDSILSLSKSIVDALPSSDASWAEGSESETAFILQQSVLREKQKKYTLFLMFLTRTKLSVDFSHKTRFILTDHGEKLEAAKALWDTLQNADRAALGLLNKSVQNLLVDRLAANPSLKISLQLLRPQHVFFSCVSQIGEIFRYLLESLEELLSKLDQNNSENIQTAFLSIGLVNHVYLDLILSSNKYRANNDKYYQFNPTLYPWTYSNEIRNCCLKQCELIENFLEGLPALSVQGSQSVQQLQNECARLYEIMLDALQDKIRRMKESDDEEGDAKNPVELQNIISEFRQLVSVAVQPFMKDRKDLALHIAEQYGEYNALIQLCNELGSPHLLIEYLQKFPDTDYPARLFAWYRQEKRFGELFDQLPEESLPVLEQNLKSSPELLWLHALKVHNYELCYETLEKLVKLQNKTLDDSRIHLSAGKLANCATGHRYKKTLANLMRLHNLQNKYLGENQTRLSPQSLIQNLLQHGTDSHGNIIPLTVEQFTKALDVFARTVQLLQKKAPETLLSIWEKCAKEIPFSSLKLLYYGEETSNEKNLIDQITQTVFFKVAMTAEAEDQLTPEVKKQLSQSFTGKDGEIFQAILNCIHQRIQERAANIARNAEKLRAIGATLTKRDIKVTPSQPPSYTLDKAYSRPTLAPLTTAPRGNLPSSQVAEGETFVSISKHHHQSPLSLFDIPPTEPLTTTQTQKTQTPTTTTTTTTTTTIPSFAEEPSLFSLDHLAREKNNVSTRRTYSPHPFKAEDIPSLFLSVPTRGDIPQTPEKSSATPAATPAAKTSSADPATPIVSTPASTKLSTPLFATPISSSSTLTSTPASATPISSTPASTPASTPDSTPALTPVLSTPSPTEASSQHESLPAVQPARMEFKRRSIIVKKLKNNQG